MFDCTHCRVDPCECNFLERTSAERRKLEDEVQSLREEVRLLQAENESLLAQIDRLEDKIQQSYEYEGY